MVNTVKVAFQQLFQASGGSDSIKKADVKKTAFDTVMKQNNQQNSRKANDAEVRKTSKKVVSSMDTIAAKVSKTSDKKIQNPENISKSEDVQKLENVSKLENIQKAETENVQDVEVENPENNEVAQQMMTETEDSQNFMSNIVQETVETDKMTEDGAEAKTAEAINMVVKNGLSFVETVVENIAEEVPENDNEGKIPFTQDTEDLMETISAFLKPIEENIKNIIKKDMDLDEEDIQKVLEQIGISLTDLLDTSNLQQFVLENAKEEIGALLTDETLSTQFHQVLTDMNAMSQELEGNLEMKKEDISQLSVAKEMILKKADMKQEKVDLSENYHAVEEAEEIADIDLKEIDTLLKKVSSLVKENVTENKIQPIVSERSSDIKQAELPDDTDAKIQQNEMPEQDFIVVEKEAVQENANHFSKQQSSGKQSQTKENIVTQFVQELVQARTNTEEPIANTAEHLQQMREIVTQVVEQIKIVVKADTSAMEMQLNPEKLGKVQLSVVSKNGQMTAHFATENEIAKNALESQMQSLKDTLQNQGLKVDAIEVSVSDFRFEQSTNMNEGQQQQQTSDNKKKAPRKIDLSMLEDGFDDLSEEDTLAAQVMIDNGNTVDYTA